MAAPDLAKLTAETEAKLKEIHAEIGVTADETQARLQKLQEDIRQIFQSAINGTQNEKQGLKDSIVSLTSQAQQIGEQLKEQTDVEAKLQQVDRSSLRSNVSSLEKLIATLSEKKAKRQEVLQGFLDKLSPLYNELGISPPSPFDQLGTEFSTDKISKFEAELKDIEFIKRQRVDEVGFLVSDISNLWRELCITPADCTSDLDQRILQSQNTTARTLGLSADTIVRLKARKEELDAEKHSRLAEIDRLSKLILPLWERLEVPDAEKRAFSASVNGISLDIIQKYRVELARLEELKLQKMGDLIRTARVQINALCDEMKISEEDRQMFKPAYMDVFTEQTLAMHEAEIVRLQERLQSIKVLLDMVAKRESYRQRIAASKVTSSDPNRFQRRDLAKILKEEEECKKLKDNGLPKLETKLMDEIKLWENAHNEPFMIDGCAFVEVILKDQEERRAEDAAKKNKKENHDGANVQVPPATPVKKGAATPAPPSSAQRGGPRKA